MKGSANYKLTLFLYKDKWMTEFDMLEMNIKWSQSLGAQYLATSELLSLGLPIFT